MNKKPFLSFFVPNYGYHKYLSPIKTSLVSKLIKKNYPKNSYIVSKDDIEKMQLMAFFASGAFSCFSRKHFLELNGHQGYNIISKEDMLYSKFVLNTGYKKAYVNEAVVAHLHKY